MSYTPAQGGHAPGNVRDAFLAAINAFEKWREGPEPTVELEGGAVPISQVCGLLWNCTDQMPSGSWGRMDEPDGRTYAMGARVLKGPVAEKMNRR
jgi:hypothetical protein